MASITFHEDKYEYNNNIAEFFNTFLSLSYIFVGLCYCTTSLKIGLSSIIVGIGSMILHGTMTKTGQWIDEIGMICLVFYMIQFYVDVKNNVLRLFILIYFMFHDNFMIFFILFTLLIGILLYQFYKFNCLNRKLMFLSSFSVLCWTIGQTSYELRYLHLHSIWHMSSSLCLYYALDEMF